MKRQLRIRNWIDPHGKGWGGFAVWVGNRALPDLGNGGVFAAVEYEGVRSLWGVRSTLPMI